MSKFVIHIHKSYNCDTGYHTGKTYVVQGEKYLATSKDAADAKVYKVYKSAQRAGENLKSNNVGFEFEVEEII